MNRLVLLSTSVVLAANGPHAADGEGAESDHGVDNDRVTSDPGLDSMNSCEVEDVS